jgi:hypothetical protein
MKMPEFGAEASLCRTSRPYHAAGSWTIGVDIQVGLSQVGRPLPIPDLFHCSPCIDGQQFCCPPRGFGIRCFVRSCITPL